jgi:hypothetical protein
LWQAVGLGISQSPAHIWEMKISWDGQRYVAERSAEERAACAAYYRNPVVVWFEAGHGVDGVVVGGPLPKSGFYVMHHCGHADCCRPEGPFDNEAEAREWSRQNLVLPYV